MKLKLPYALAFLLAVLLALHLFAIFFPSNGKVMDEAYYVPASQNLLNFTASNIEHPFFGKVWGAIGIALFGDNFFGWRIFYVIIGLLSVASFYYLARLFLSDTMSLLASAFLGFENIFFEHTSLLLLDGPPILFAILGFFFYFKKRHYISALMFGLSVLSKEWGVYFVFALLIYHLYSKRNDLKHLSLGIVKKVFVFSAIIVLVFSGPIWVYDYVYHPYTYLPVVARPAYTQVVGLTGITVGPHSTVTVGINASFTNQTSIARISRFNITNPLQNWIFYVIYQSSLTGCPSTEWNCYPWLWILPYNSIDPMPYYVAPSQSNPSLVPIDWLGIGNLIIWYSFWPILLVCFVKIFKREFSDFDALVLALIAGTYLPTLILSLVFHRVLYAFYMINTDIGLALGIPLVISYVSKNMKEVKIIALLWFSSALGFFILFFPVHPLDLIGIEFGSTAPYLAIISIIYTTLLSYIAAKVIMLDKPKMVATVSFVVVSLGLITLLAAFPNLLTTALKYPLKLGFLIFLIGETFSLLYLLIGVARSAIIPDGAYKESQEQREETDPNIKFNGYRRC